MTVRADSRRLVVRAGKHFLRWLGEFQKRHSRVATTPVLDKLDFPWTQALEANWQNVREELDGVMVHPERIPAFHQLSPDQQRISKGDQWKAFTFYVYGHRIDENCLQCPATASLLDGLPGLENAWFSILAPGYHIPAHRGPTRAVIRCHLALHVPLDWQNCWLRVDDQICHWREGEVLVFDDTYEHEVENATPEIRVVLFLDFDRPMDRVGALVNFLVIKLLRGSVYVQDPLKNLREWNARQRSDRGNAAC